MTKRAQGTLDLTPAKPEWASIQKALPRELRQACGTMAKGDGWKEFLTARLGKWALQETPLSERQKSDGYQIAVTSESFYDLAVEYGYRRLLSIFGAADGETRASEQK